MIANFLSEFAGPQRRSACFYSPGSRWEFGKLRLNEPRDQPSLWSFLGLEPASRAAVQGLSQIPHCPVACWRSSLWRKLARHGAFNPMQWRTAADLYSRKE